MGFEDNGIIYQGNELADKLFEEIQNKFNPERLMTKNIRSDGVHVNF